MPLFKYDEKKAHLSIRLTVRIENLVKEFCYERNIPHSNIPELLNHLALSRLAQNLGIKVKVEELVEDPVVAVAKETPLEIINRLTALVSDSQLAYGGSGSPKIVL